MNSIRVRNIYDLSGVVQGVGFRPTLLRLANSAGLSGWIQNRTDSVRIMLEGPVADVSAFLQSLQEHLPVNATLSSISLIESTPIQQDEQLDKFSILPSFQNETCSLLIPADLSICTDCAREITDSSDRRYGYPFTTCINCGPRYTIIHSTPYDRERTTMSAFPMCEDCRREYMDPANRRFHAETIACHRCGPKLSIKDSSGAIIEGDALGRARSEIFKGGIIGIRGIGGFLLAADALNRKAVILMRTRKNRPHKPFAVMARDIDVLRKYCLVTPESEHLLKSAEAPIVILDVKPQAVAGGMLPIDLITPDAMTMGAMLPGSPLHKLLFEPLNHDAIPAFELLIMTSGNRGGEPICITNDEAFDRLSLIADYILIHDREINLRNDDSLCVIRRGMPQIWRRARGYAPNQLRLTQGVTRNILAMGSDMKNAVTLAYGNCAVISPHIGDLETPEALDSLEAVVKQLPAFLNIAPQAVAVDLHPDMNSTKLGRKIAGKAGIPVTEVQHHHAHAMACLAENDTEQGLALVFDGTGMGIDGTIWGAELLSIEASEFRRLATFAGVPLPGGEAAIRQPARQLIARFTKCGAGVSKEWIERLGISENDTALWAKQCLENINAPVTHAAGRVFDSFSALLGLAPGKITYEGQPAILLEAAARKFRGHKTPALPYSKTESDGALLIDWNPAFAMLSETRVFAGYEADYALAVHHAIASAALVMAEYGMNRTHMRTIALSGGVFMNGILNDLLIPGLEKLGLNVLIHHKTPPNDGCISFGQAVITGSR